MKRFLILLMLLLGMVLVGCGKDVEDEVAPAPEVEEEEKTEREEVSVYTVTFDSKGGSAIPSQTVEKGSKVKKPEILPQCEWLVLSGWYNGNEEWSFERDVVTRNITLTARWEQKNVKSLMTEKEIEYINEYLAENWSDKCACFDDILYIYQIPDAFGGVIENAYTLYYEEESCISIRIPPEITDN